MPAAEVHDKITLITAAPLVPITLIAAPDRPVVTMVVLVTSHLLSGLLFSCDLDVDSRQYRRWGPLRFLWWPYKEAVAHRSWISHGLVVGPLLRLVYFGMILSVLLWLVLQVTGYPADAVLQYMFLTLLLRYPVQSAAFLIGFVLGGAAHSIPDWITTGTKRRWNQWTKF